MPVRTFSTDEIKGMIEIIFRGGTIPQAEWDQLSDTNKGTVKAGLKRLLTPDQPPKPEPEPNQPSGTKP